LDLREKTWQEAGEHCIMNNFIKSYALPNIIRVIKENGMDRACSTHGSDRKCIQSVGQKL